MLALRFIFLLTGLIAGGLLGHLGESGVHPTLRLQSVLGGCLFGVGTAIIVIVVEAKLRSIGLKTMFGATIGSLISLVMANLITFSLTSLALTPSTGNKVLVLLVNFSAIYLGAAIGARVIQELDLTVLSSIFKGKSEYGTFPKVFDTSVIIDGRIADVVASGIIEGTILIPNFVLEELHHIADASDAVKRTRGRRGMEVVERLQKNSNVDIRIIDIDFPKIKEVDQKLIALCLKVNGKIATNDYNLYKVAELQGIGVININELASATKPLILPGEEMPAMHVIKEGKEHNQGVAYLDDGTMVVIDNARKDIGHTINVVVTSVLQTPTGRMIFAKKGSESGSSLGSVA